MSGRPLGLLGLALLLTPFLTACGGAAGPADPPAVSVSPQTAIVGTNESLSLSASVQGAAGTSVSWKVNGVAGGNSTLGTVSPTGVYDAPAAIPNPATVIVTAVLQSDASADASASLTIVTPLALTPTQTSLTTSQTLQLQAAGPNITNANVVWSVDGVANGNVSSGTISGTGLYTPAAASGIHTIGATTSNASPAFTATMTVSVTNFAGVFSWRNDASLTGQNRQELALIPASITNGQFGKLFPCQVDGYIYAQPLYVANAKIAAGQPATLHSNVVFVATEHDSVYAFDADAAPCQQLWQTNFVANLGGAVAGISTISACATITPTCTSNDVNSDDIVPEIGITGTPVIDPMSKTLYVVAATKENGSYVQRLHALDLTTGAEKFGGPATIQASVPGAGDGGDGRGNVLFSALVENQRAGLLLAGGNVYVAYGSYGSNDSAFHGWLLAYNATTLAHVAAFNTTPNGVGGGLWGAGAAPAADAAGNIFVATGSGTFDAAVTGAPYNNDFGESALRLTTATGLVNADYFTPSNQVVMNLTPSTDLGSSGMLLLPDAAGSAQHPQLVILGSQDGTLYLLDRNHLGGFTPGGPDNGVQELMFGLPFDGTPALWQGTMQGAPQNVIYTAASGDHLKAFSLANGTLAATPSSQSSETFNFPGASPATSSNGSNDGIVWVLDISGYGANGAGAMPAVLHAYDATNLSNELYSSATLMRDAAGSAVKFAVPTVANGRVFVGTQTELSVYGLLP